MFIRKLFNLIRPAEKQIKQVKVIKTIKAANDNFIAANENLQIYLVENYSSQEVSRFRVSPESRILEEKIEHSEYFTLPFYNLSKYKQCKLDKKLHADEEETVFSYDDYFSYLLNKKGQKQTIKVLLKVKKESEKLEQSELFSRLKNIENKFVLLGEYSDPEN